MFSPRAFLARAPEVQGDILSQRALLGNKSKRMRELLWSAAFC